MISAWPVNSLLSILLFPFQNFLPALHIAGCIQRCASSWVIACCSWCFSIGAGTFTVTWPLLAVYILFWPFIFQSSVNNYVIESGYVTSVVNIVATFVCNYLSMLIIFLPEILIVFSLIRINTWELRAKHFFESNGDARQAALLNLVFYKIRMFFNYWTFFQI